MIIIIIIITKKCSMYNKRESYVPRLMLEKFLEEEEEEEGRNVKEMKHNYTVCYDNDGKKDTLTHANSTPHHINERMDRQIDSRDK